MTRNEWIETEPAQAICRGCGGHDDDHNHSSDETSKGLGRWIRATFIEGAAVVKLESSSGLSDWSPQASGGVGSCKAVVEARGLTSGGKEGVTRCSVRHGYHVTKTQCVCPAYRPGQLKLLTGRVIVYGDK